MAYRMMKWVGDPERLRGDGKSVANWKYENHRVITMPGFTARLLEPYEVVGKDIYGREIRKPNGLSRRYYWPPDLPGFVLEVEEADADIIKKLAPYEFVDVTGIDDPSYVRSDIVLGGRRVISGKTDTLSNYLEYRDTVVEEGVKRGEVVSGRSPTDLPKR